MSETDPSTTSQRMSLLPPGLVTAMRMLTILSVPGTETDHIGRSQPWFPIVGLIVGSMVLGIAWGINLITGGWSGAAAVAALAATAWLTRGFHLDGLSDCADGFWGGYSKDRILSIMKDSRVGAFGVIALVLALLTQWVAFERLISLGAWSWIPAAMLISRTTQVILAALQPYARPEGGTGHDFVKQAGRRNVMIVGLLSILLLLVLPGVGLWGLVALVTALLATILFGRFCNNRIGGITGDTLGAVSVLTEILALFAGAIIAGL